MSVIVIYGPPATGKTINADRFRQHYNRSRVIDEWRPRSRFTPQDIRPGDLILTTESVDNIRRHLPHARLISITEARAACNLGPVPRIIGRDATITLGRRPLA